MIATIWNNGEYHQSGVGYGIKINEQDRDRFFNREWQSVFLKLSGQEKEIEINIDKPSFWDKTCRELINKEIGLWLLDNNLERWEKGNPPKVKIESVEGQRFNVSII